MVSREMRQEDEFAIPQADHSQSCNPMRHFPVFQVNDEKDDQESAHGNTYFGTSDRLRRGKALLIDTGAGSNFSASEWVERMNQMNCKSGLAQGYSRCSEIL